MKRNSRQTPFRTADPVCNVMLYDYDDSFSKKKPWMDKVDIIKIEEIKKSKGGVKK